MTEINSGLRLILDITRAQSTIIKKLEGPLSMHGLGFNDFVILHHLSMAPEGKLRRIDLAEKVCITASGITRMLAPMEKTGLVSRETNERDARISIVVLTPAGKELYQHALKTVKYTAAELFPAAKAKKTEKLTELLAELM
jgi:DNA-binding MarR family transcriptional regulator